MRKLIQDLIYRAGIEINGNAPWDIQVHNEKFYKRVFDHGSLGLGESYMDAWWDCDALDQLFSRVLAAKLNKKIKTNYAIFLKFLLVKLFNLQTKKRALIVGKKHYDLNNFLFQCMLDKRMNYSCGYWKNANNLEEAQVAKLDLICRKLLLEPGMRVLDIGCGWGGFAKFAAENYGVKVTGITISKEQYEYAKKNCQDLSVDIRFEDYRDIKEQFDRIVSIGMFEHVGHLNYRHYLQVAHQNLTESGLFLLHTIGNNETTFEVCPWVRKYIFPNGFLPSIQQIARSIEKLFVMEDWHNFGADYDKTLMAWNKNFRTHWDALKNYFDERFYRMWNYYLLSCAGIFRVRELQLWQIVLSKKGVLGGYQSVR